MSPQTRKIIRWIARVWAALMAAFILFMTIGEAALEGFGPIFHLAFWESLMVGAFSIVFTGLILAWKWERLGGWLIIGGMAAFYLLNLIFSGDFPRGPFFVIIALPGILFLISYYTRKKAETV